jgi:hypothetical protein
MSSMPKNVDFASKLKIKELYVSGCPVSELSSRFQVHPRTIRRWADDENWKVDRPSRIAETVTREDEPESSDELPETLEIVEQTIVALRRQLAAGLSGRDAASIGNALDRLLKRRDELRFKNVGGLVDFVVNVLGKWDLKPVDFIIELRDRRHRQ